MREATIRLTINEADAGNWLLQAHELNVHPERTVRDVVQQITEQLNDADARAAIAVFVVGVADSDAARAAFPVNVRFEFTNGGRGWEARADLDAWLLLTLSLVAEHGAEHGPITSDRNRAATKAYARARGFIR